jgi:VWFA-related protein
MARKGFVLPIGALLCLSAALADEPVVFRGDVSLVRVDAQVVDRDNRAITGLGPQDFVLREQGKLQPIRSVDTENLPVDLVLLLDVSASMRPHVERIASASHEAMRQLREQDRVAILVFDRSSRVRMDFRSSQSGVDRELERVLDDENFRGGTDITRAMFDATDYVQRQGRRDSRKAIVIVTDDQTEFDRNVEGVERALARADAVMSALIAPDAMRGMQRNPNGYPGGSTGGAGPLGGPLGGIIFGSPRGRQRGGGQMGSHTQSAGTAEIARESGGDSMPVSDTYALQDTLARIRQRYALYFSLPPGVRAGEERQIELQLADAAQRRSLGTEVHYRRSYYAPNSTPGNSGSTVVSQSGADPNRDNAASPEEPDRPYLRRRPGVSQVPDRSHEGPLNADSTPDAAPAPAAQQPTAQQSAAAPSGDAAQQANPPAAPPSDPNAPGWRKARPNE